MTPNILRSVNIPLAIFTGAHNRIDADSLHTLLLRGSRSPEARHVLTIPTVAAIGGATPGALGARHEAVLLHARGHRLLLDHVLDVGAGEAAADLASAVVVGQVRGRGFLHSLVALLSSEFAHVGEYFGFG